MLTIEEIREALKERSIMAVTRATKINRTTLWRIKKGYHANPNLKTVQALSDHIKTTPVTPVKLGRPRQDGE